MKVTRKTVVDKMAAYLQREIDLADLVEWAEAAMMDAEFDERHLEEIRDAVARLGLADVRAFGLTWEDCRTLLEKLGHSADIKITAA